MAYSQKKLADRELEYSSKTVEPNLSALSSFEGFLDLLIDLNILSPSSDSILPNYNSELEQRGNSFQNQTEEAKPLTCELVSSEHEIKLVDALETWAVLETPAQPKENYLRVQSAAENIETAVVEQIATAKIKPLLLPYCSDLIIGENHAVTSLGVAETAGEDDPLSLLQNLLSDPELARCRDLIVELEQKQANLESQIYQPEQLIELLIPVISELLKRKVASSDDEEIANAIAPEIAAAIRQQIIIERSAIANAIAPEMGIAIKQQITLERDAMVDALYPVIGGTIVKYMAEAMRSINEKLEKSLSPEGIIRKFRAKIQGVSEAELILKEAMPFSIEAIFLIHKSSGLVISEVQSGSQKLESEMVAGMLTAIRSFVNDCITNSGGNTEVDAIEYGNSKILLEVAGYCYLAIVTEGEPPQWFVDKIRQALSAIVQNYGELIESFEGDPATIPEQVNALLEELTTSLKSKAKSPPIALIIGSVILSLILLPWGIFQYNHAIARRIEANTTQALASTPELAVYRLTVNSDRKTLKLSGMLPNQYLRQKAEQIAKDVAPNLKLENKIIAVDVPPDPITLAAEVKRITRTLNQINTIAIKAKYVNRQVTIEGTVSDFAEAGKITKAFEQIPGVHSVSNTVQLKSPLSTIKFYFNSGSSKLKVADIDSKIIPIKQFLNRYPEKHLKIIGHSVSNSNFVSDRQLALQRALSVQNALISQGIDSKRMQVVGMAEPQKSMSYHQPLWLMRYVEIQAIAPDKHK